MQSFHQPRLHMLRNRLRLHALEDLERPFRRVKDDPTVRALLYVPLNLGPELWVKRIVEKIVQILQELLTGKQRRRPPFA
jgi:hypothetical protein